jgi:hypothetical protein
MDSAEQKELIAALREVEARMSRADAERFAMFRKRDRDDEDLDLLSERTLRELHATYVTSRATRGNPLDALFGS